MIKKYVKLLLKPFPTRNSVNKMQLSQLLVLLFTFTFTLADVAVLKPSAGQTFSASSGSVDITITWMESNGSPKLSEIGSYSFLLCSGPNGDIKCGNALKKVKASDLSENQITVTVPSTYGNNGNYYIQVYAENSKGYTIHYTNRFKLTGMSGTAFASSATDTSPPPGQTSLRDEGDTGTINMASFTIPYTKQTGVSRFAPMQTQPGKSVTVTTWTRRYPISSVSYFSTLINSLQQLTTITPGWSYTISSAHNYATPAPMPSDGGSWYDPKERMTLNARKLNKNRITRV